jgi:hypothetical protein
VSGNGRGGGRSSKAQWSISSLTFWIRHQRTYHYSLFTNIQWDNFWIILTTSLSSRCLPPSLPWGSDPHSYRNFYSLQADPPLDANTQIRITIRFPSMVVCSSAPPPSSRPLENHLRVVIQTVVLPSSQWISNPASLPFLSSACWVITPTLLATGESADPTPTIVRAGDLRDLTSQLNKTLHHYMAIYEVIGL